MHLHSRAKSVEIDQNSTKKHLNPCEKIIELTHAIIGGMNHGINQG